MQQQIGNPKNTVHWSSDLVTHIGKEFTFGPTGCFSRLLGLHQILCTFGHLFFQMIITLLNLIQHIIKAAGQKTKLIITCYRDTKIILFLSGYLFHCIGKGNNRSCNNPQQAGGQQHGCQQAKYHDCSHTSANQKHVAPCFLKAHLN